MLWFILFSWWWQLWPGVTRAFNSTAVGAAANVWKTADDGTWKHLKTLYPDLSEPHTFQPTSATHMSPPHAHRCTDVWTCAGVTHKTFCHVKGTSFGTQLWLGYWLLAGGGWREESSDFTSDWTGGKVYFSISGQICDCGSEWSKLTQLHRQF